MSAHSFPVQHGKPVVTITLATPGLTQPPAVTQRETFSVDTGFSDHLQIDWNTFCALGLSQFRQGTAVAQLADGSTITDVLSLVRVLIPECGIDRMMPCISNPEYGKNLLLVGRRFLKVGKAVIDFHQEQTTLER